MKALFYNGITGKKEAKEVLSVSNPFGELKDVSSPDYLNAFNGRFIITAAGKVYQSDDTPGYCDYEERVIEFINN